MDEALEAELVDDALEAEDEDAYGRFAAVKPTDCRAGFETERVSCRKSGVESNAYGFTGVEDVPRNAIPALWLLYPRGSWALRDEL